MKERDDELTLFWRTVYESGDVYTEFLNRIENGDKLGQVQQEKGSLYQVKDRELKHEKKHNQLRNNSLLKDFNLGKRVTWLAQTMVHPHD